MEALNLAQTRITGTEINYLFICPRKLWLFHHHIEMEHTSDYVALGQLLHEDSYPRQTKESLIADMIRIDFVDKDGVLHDIKSGKSMETAHEMQILYYLYVLKQMGLPNRKGVINYTRQRRTTEVELTSDKEQEIEAAMAEVGRVNSMSAPPDAEFTKLCRKCSYAELCWS